MKRLVVKHQYRLDEDEVENLERDAASLEKMADAFEAGVPAHSETANLRDKARRLRAILLTARERPEYDSVDSRGTVKSHKGRFP